MGSVKHEFFVRPDREIIVPPKCIKGGRAPCPTCPVRGHCEWGIEVIEE